MQLLYFASVREAIGRDEESFDLPSELVIISDIIAWLSAKDDKYAAAFAAPEKLRFALDQQMVKIDASIGSAQELAIFPPVTGG